MPPHIKSTVGAVLVGGLIASMMTGVVLMQTLVYFRTFPKDKLRIKGLVSLIWFLDILHTGMVYASIWIYLLDHYGELNVGDKIPWTVALTVFITALLTFSVYCFFAHRVFTLSKHNTRLTVTILLLALLRLAFATVTTVKMITIASFSGYKHQVGWVFTLGLATSTILDILICSSLLYYLRQSRTGFSSMDQIITSLSIYTIETGLMTCVGTVLALIFWLVMSKGSLVFFAIHFILCKLYANSLLATLNARAVMRARRNAQSDDVHHLPMPVVLHSNSSGSRNSRPITDVLESRLQISVERDIHYEIDERGVKRRTQDEDDPVYSLNKSVEYEGEKKKMEYSSMTFDDYNASAVVNSFTERISKPSSASEDDSVRVIVS